jgi:hypothetical protein
VTNTLGKRLSARTAFFIVRGNNPNGDVLRQIKVLTPFLVKYSIFFIINSRHSSGGPAHCLFITPDEIKMYRTE